MRFCASDFGACFAFVRDLRPKPGYIKNSEHKKGMLRKLIQQSNLREAICITTEKRNRKKIPYHVDILSQSALDSLEKHCRQHIAARAVQDNRRMALRLHSTHFPPVSTPGSFE